MRFNNRFFKRSNCSMAIVFAVVLLSGCERYKLDQQMNELCKKDAGVKVYETIRLSADQYQIVFNYVTKAKSREEYYGPEYWYITKREHLVGKEDDAGSGRGELIRHYSAIYRKADHRLLGESVWYARVGGDFFTFGFQPSSNSCPRPSSDLGLSVFLKGK